MKTDEQRLDALRNKIIFQYDLKAALKYLPFLIYCATIGLLIWVILS